MQCIISIPSPIILPYWRSVGLIIIPANLRLHLGYVETFPVGTESLTTVNTKNKKLILLSYTNASQEG